MIAIPLLVWYNTYKNKDVPTNGLVYPLGNVFFRIYARVGNVRSRPAPQEITGRSKNGWKTLQSARPPPGCMIRGLNMTTAALVQLWISRAAKPTKRSTMLCRSWSTWNTVPVRMPKAKPAMVSVSCCRSATSSSKKLPKEPALRWATSVTTALACSFSHRKS